MRRPQPKPIRRADVDVGLFEVNGYARVGDLPRTGNDHTSSIALTQYRGSSRSSLYSKLAKSEPDCWIRLFGSGGYFAAASARRAFSSAHRLWVFEITFTLWGWPCLSSWNVHFI